MLIGLAAANSVPTEKEFDWSNVKSPLRELVKAQNDNLTPTITGRIVGGSIATANQFPHQAALLINYSTGEFFCGGSIIGQKLILTAAHCVEG